MAGRLDRRQGADRDDRRDMMALTFGLVLLLFVVALYVLALNVLRQALTWSDDLVRWLTTPARRRER